jgi:hypothetical protein
MTTKPTQELERLFGPKWPEVIDKLEEREPVTITYQQDAEVVGFSYRHDTLCLYFGIEGERKTLPLSDIISIEHDIFSEEE